MAIAAKGTAEIVNGGTFHLPTTSSIFNVQANGVLVVLDTASHPNPNLPTHFFASGTWTSAQQQ